MGFDVKNTTNFGLLDLIFPFTCRGCGRLGSLLCERCKKYNIRADVKICPRCRKNRKKCSCAVPVYAFSYREGLIVKLLEDYKYKSVRATAKILAECLDLIVPKDLEEAIVVPLPTSGKHIRERGLDHTRLIAKELCKMRLGFNFKKVLVRHGNAVQVGKDEETRRRQAERAYEVVSEVSSEKTYLLIDDVWTTGASMEAAISVMQKAGANKLASAVILMPR